jgi:hypothetical protein
MTVVFMWLLEAGLIGLVQALYKPEIQLAADTLSNLEGRGAGLS